MQPKTSKALRLVPYLAILGGGLFGLSHWLIFAYAPEEKVMGIIQKIFYIHVPMAWWGLFSFFLVFLGSIIYLRTRSAFWDALNEAAAEIGLLLATLVLFTGSIWARVSWNTWWTWDPRLSTTLIMWFIYAAYLIIRRLDMPKERMGTVSAVIGIAAFIDVPLVFFSTRLWPQSLHPVVVGKSGGGMNQQMLTTMLLCIAAFGALWVALLIIRHNLGLTRARLEKAQLKQSLQ